MRRGALLAAAILWASAAAPAGAWVETATYDVPGGSIADCLRAAGPGQLALLGPLGRTSTPTALLGAGADGDSLTPAGSLTLGWFAACPEVATADGAPPLLAAPVPDPRRPRSGPAALAVGSPGGAVAELPLPAGASFDGIALAGAPDGAAVAAWQEDSLRSGLSTSRLLVAIRPAGQATFRRPTLLDASAGLDAGPAVGIDAAGQATVAWQHAEIHANHEDDTARVAASQADGSFGAPQQLGQALGASLALAVAPQGRALLVVGTDQVLAFERPGGSERFAPVRLPASESADQVAAALNADGGAVIAYRPDRASVAALVRTPGGRFRVGGAIEPTSLRGSNEVTVFDYGSLREPVAPYDDHGGDLAIALAPDGRTLLTWVDEARGGGAAAAHVARGTLGSGFGRPSRLGSPCRSAVAAQPLALADGQLGVAWADDAYARMDDSFTLPLGGGHVHVALAGLTPGARRPSAPSGAVGLSARLTSTRPLAVGKPLRVRVSCRTRCEVRVSALSQPAKPPRWARGEGLFSSPSALGASTALAAGRGAVLSLAPQDGYDAAGARGAPRTPIAVLACTPGAPVAQRVRLAAPPAAPALPIPRVLDLVARRRGDGVRVSWRTSIPARRARFYVIGDTSSGDAGAFVTVRGGGRARFAVTLRPKHGERIRTVDVELTDSQLAGGIDLTVRVQ